LNVYRVEQTIKEEFVVNAIQIEMQRRHFYTLCHAVKAKNALVAYQTKHMIINIDMV
jgi:hypothetical protein